MCEKLVSVDRVFITIYAKGYMYVKNIQYFIRC